MIDTRPGDVTSAATSQEKSLTRSTVQTTAITPWNRKNALFAGSDGGAENWAVVASLIESCKLNAIDPQAYLSDVITKIVNGHPNIRIDELLRWAYATSH